MKRPSLARMSWLQLRNLLGTHRLLRAMNLYPPFLGAGIRVTHVAPDLRTFEVELRLRPWNRNYVGTHFGGSLYAMCDPFFMLILIENLGRDYLVWDKSATVHYLKPGRGVVRATFHIPASSIDEIRRRADLEGRHAQTFEVEVVDASGEPVARITKHLTIRRKSAAPARPPMSEPLPSPQPQAR